MPIGPTNDPPPGGPYDTPSLLLTLVPPPRIFLGVDFIVPPACIDRGFGTDLVFCRGADLTNLPPEFLLLNIDILLTQHWPNLFPLT